MKLYIVMNKTLNKINMTAFYDQYEYLWKFKARDLTLEF